jgi:hypothetical protein
MERGAEILRKGKTVESFKNIASDVVTAYENGTYGPGAYPAADHVVEAIREYGKWAVLAASAVIESEPNHFEDIPADRIMEFMEENYLNHSGATVGHALETYAQGMAENGSKTELALLYDRLDRAGGVDLFDWSAYADADRTPTMGMHFVQMPVPAGEAGVFLFGS